MAAAYFAMLASELILVLNFHDLKTFCILLMILLITA